MTRDMNKSKILLTQAVERMPRRLIAVRSKTQMQTQPS